MDIPNITIEGKNYRWSDGFFATDTGDILQADALVYISPKGNFIVAEDTPQAIRMCNDGEWIYRFEDMQCTGREINEIIAERIVAHGIDVPQNFCYRECTSMMQLWDFNRKLNNHNNKKSMEDRELINEIMERAQSEEGQRLADEAIARYRNAPSDKRVFDLKEQDIMKVLKVSYIAERFFGRSRSWLCHKLNHDMRNGKPDDFTDEERKKLKDALDTIAYEIQILSDNM